MEYKKADKNDISALVALRKQQLLDEGLPPLTNIDSELNTYFLSSMADGSFISWLALDDMKIVTTSGICFYRLPPTYSNPTGHVAYITNMFTKKAYRRQGIASHLLKLVIDEAKVRDYKLVRLHASSAGRSIYSRMGFTVLDGFMTMKLQ